MPVPKLSEQLSGIHQLSAFSAALQAVDASVPGSFTYEDALVFSALINAQSIRGDMLEIGVLNGKTAAVLALCLRSAETLHLCDLFETEIAGVNDAYKRHPSADEVRANVLRAAPGATIVLHELNSTALQMPEASVRFIHIDGDHGLAGCLADLRNSWRWLSPGGLVAVDDYAHPDWPDVERAVSEFRHETPDAVEVIDYNRRGAKGRKIVFAKT